MSSISFPEAAIFWKSAIHGLPVTLRMPRVKSDKSIVLVSIYFVYKAIQNRNVVGPGQGPDFQRMTKGTPGDEVAVSILQERAIFKLESRGS